MKLMLIIALIVFWGCGRTSEEDRASTTGAQSSAKSGVDQVIDDFTGKTAIDAGKRAKSTIERVQARKKQDYEAVLGE